MRSLCALTVFLILVALTPTSATDTPPLQKKTKKTEKGKKADPPAKDDFVNVGDLYAEVMVLNVLHILQPSAKQVAILQKAAAKTMQKPPPRKMVKVSERLHKALGALRDGLLRDDEKVEELFVKFEELRQKENPDLDDVELTSAAREQAPVILAALSARQVAAYVGSVPDFPDPLERLVQTMDESRKVRGKEWQGLRDDTAEQVGWLVAGLDDKAEEKVRTRATALLNKAFHLSEKDYARDREALEKEAREIVGKLPPTDVLRHFMERVLCEMLSSHQLTTALEAMAKKK